MRRSYRYLALLLTVFLPGIAQAQIVTATPSATGTGLFVRQTSPAFITPALGIPSSGTVTNLTGTASININGTVGATTPASGAFTTIVANSSVSGTSFIPLGSTVISGLYLKGANNPALGAIGTEAANWTTTQWNFTGAREVSINSTLVDDTGTFQSVLAAGYSIVRDQQSSLAFYLANNTYYSSGNKAFATGASYQIGMGQGLGQFQFQVAPSVSANAAQTFATVLTISSAGVITASNLAGTGSRAVLADASGILSAPVSDETMKGNWKPIDGLAAAHEFVSSGKIGAFDWNTAELRARFGSFRQIGVGAQTAARIGGPALGGQEANGSWYANYEKLGVYSIAGLVQVDDKIKALDAANAELRNRIARLERMAGIHEASNDNFFSQLADLFRYAQ